MQFTNVFELLPTNEIIGSCRRKWYSQNCQQRLFFAKHHQNSAFYFWFIPFWIYDDWIPPNIVFIILYFATIADWKVWSIYLGRIFTLNVTHKYTLNVHKSDIFGIVQNVYWEINFLVTFTLTQTYLLIVLHYIMYVSSCILREKLKKNLRRKKFSSIHTHNFIHIINYKYMSTTAQDLLNVQLKPAVSYLRFINSFIKLF